jgi:chromosome segregation ATPase
MNSKFTLNHTNVQTPAPDTSSNSLLSLRTTPSANKSEPDPQLWQEILRLRTELDQVRQERDLANETVDKVVSDLFHAQEDVQAKESEINGWKKRTEACATELQQEKQRLKELIESMTEAAPTANILPIDNANVEAQKAEVEVWKAALEEQTNLLAEERLKSSKMLEAMKSRLERTEHEGLQKIQAMESRLKEQQQSVAMALLPSQDLEKIKVDHAAEVHELQRRYIFFKNNSERLTAKIRELTHENENLRHAQTPRN